ncbi:MAG: hypothetical protein D6771_07745, partial [Zetaproteobacteria bacterium]
MANAMDDTLRKLTRACEVAPDDPEHWMRLALARRKRGRMAGAMLAARRAWLLFSADETHKRAELERIFGREVLSEDAATPGWLDCRALADALDAKTRQAHTLKLPEGAVLMRKGEPADLLYLVLKGRLAVLGETSEGRPPKLVNFVGPGALLGESALEEGAVRTATVVAAEPAVVLRLAPEMVIRAWGQQPELFIAFCKERMMRTITTALSSTPLFGELPLGVLRVLARVAWIEPFAPEETIKPAHTYMPAFAVILRGVVHMLDTGEDPPVYAGRGTQGTVLGLPRLLGEEPPALMYRAETKTELLFIPFDAMEDLMWEMPSFALRVRKAAEQQTQTLMQTIAL